MNIGNKIFMTKSHIKPLKKKPISKLMFHKVLCSWQKHNAWN